MSNPRKTADEPKILSRRVLVIIRRDKLSETPLAVWQHELPILEGMHGEGNVVVQDAEIVDEGYSAKTSPDLLPFNKVQDKVRKPSETLGLGFVFTGDPRSEFDRLCSVYGKHTDVNEPWAENVFGRFASGTFSRLLGKPEIEDLPDEQLRSLVRAYGYVPHFGEHSSETEKREGHDKQKKLLNAPRAELLKLSEEVGVALA